MFVGPGLVPPPDVVGGGCVDVGVDVTVGVGVVGCVGVSVGVGARDGVGASDGVGVDVSGADVSAGGESDVDGAAESVPGELAEGESCVVPPGSGEFNVDESDGEASVGATEGVDVGPDAVLESVGDSLTIADRVVLGDVSVDVPLAEDPDDGAGDVDPGGRLTG